MLAKWNSIRVLALGGVMVLGMAMYFTLSSGVADMASQNHQLEGLSPGGTQQKVADPAEQVRTSSSSSDLRVLAEDEPTYGQQDYEVARTANQARREAEAEATMQRVEDYIARNKVHEAARAANQASREAEAEATMQRVEDYIARNKAYESARAANQARREAEAEATMQRVEDYIARNKATE